jgi:RHS repeat-associated protein
MNPARRSRLLPQVLHPARSVALAALIAVVVSGAVAPQQRVAAAPTAATAATAETTSACGSDATSPTATTAQPDHQAVVRPGESRTITYDRAKLVIGPRAVTLPVGIGITPLTGAELRRLDPGMTNVTAKPRRGYRFTPHPQTFAEAISVALPYDPALLEPGFTAQDIYTYYFDDVALCWRPLQRVSIDEVNHLVVSLTDHFTDMVNATVAVPEHPEGESFDPNEIKGIKSADPAAGVTLIAPPGATNQGDNRLSYPLSLPRGRQGLQPSLAVRYSSAAANSWLGQGWDLPTQAIVVDTRWGVPRYSATKETESYLLNGDQLTPVSHRGPPPARTAEKVFHTRVEGAFARIVRHGDSPSTYTWEVTDKTGTRYLYGGAPTTQATLADRHGNVFLWALREVRDSHDNLIRYHNVRVDDPGVDGGAEPGRNLYLQRITYTGRGTSDGRYAVTFVRDRELGQPLRLDKTIDARGGFKRVTADLLRRVDVTLDGELIRRYQFDYATGAFAKTLLRTITQTDEDGQAFTAHRFDYFDDVRDDAGQYQAFRQVPWVSPADGVGKSELNLTPAQAGRASALNANTSIGGGGHLYVGVGTSPSKSGTVGLKVGFDRTGNRGLLALVDVDGDALPDKVVRDGGSVKYHKNLSGPGGQARFAAAATALGLPGIQGEDSNTLTLGIEGYLGAVAAQLNYVNSFSTTDQYLSDVNGDGITDLINGSSVLFGRIGSGGTPVYGISADTPVPVGSRPVDPSGLVGDFAADQQRMAQSFPLLDTVRRWVAPYDGTVAVTGAVALSADTAAARAAAAKADGVRVAVQKESTELWSAVLGAQDGTEHTPTGVDAVPVTRGQRLYFRVQSRNDGSLDQVSWDPRVSYAGAPDTRDVNDLPAYAYQASRDFTLGGRSAQVTVPLTGTMHLSGDLRKLAATTDDVTAVITRNGTAVFQQTLAAGATGTIPVSLDVPVQKGQKLGWRIKVDSPVDVGQLEWTPRAAYTAADGVERVTDPAGQPLIVVDPPYDLDLYPDDGLTAPQQSYTVPADGQLTVDPTLSFDFGAATPTARIAFTVKRRGALLGKRSFDVVDGVLSGVGPITVDVTAGDELFFDFSTLDGRRDPRNPVRLRPFVTARSVTVSLGGGPAVGVPSAFHGTLDEGAFPQPYRGWGGVGYNGNGTRAAQPIAQDALVIDESFGDQLPDSVDPQAQRDDFAADPKVDPPKVVPFAPAPARQRWESGERSWVARAAASSSRLGVESVDLPGASDVGGGVAVPRLSRSEQVSLTGGVGGPIGSIGGSIATGASTGEVDFLDLNGDGFPDAAGAEGIQYTDPDGGLGDTTGDMPDGAVRRSITVSGNASAGSAARTIATGRGHASPPGHVSSTTAQAGNDMPPFSVGGNWGANKADGDFDLLDVNGDNLPDRVRADGRVALNLGYSFGALEEWRTPAPLNEGSGSNFGLNIGFNTDFYGFAGGASYSEGSSSTAKTLLDVNGDGLTDRVFKGNPLTVSLNTGNGFQPPVPFHGSLNGINGEQNASLGGGAYFTFGICFVAVCIVINPGGSVSSGLSRSEQVLRDIDGDGYADHLSSTRDDQLVVAQNQTGRTNLLRSVTRPLGGRMDFDYTRDGNTYDQPQSRWLLTKVAVHDGLPGDGQDVQLVTYEYDGGIFDRLEREFRGYGTVRERHRDHGAGDAVHRTMTREFRTDSHYTRGLLRRQVVADAAGRPFEETEHTYQLRDVGSGGAADAASTTATVFPLLARTDQRFYEGEAVAGKATHTTMEYDAVGNVTRSVDAGDPGPGDDVDTRVQYTADRAVCQSSHVVGVPDVLDVYGDGTLMRHRESTVDCATGDVTQVRAWLGTGAVATTDIEYFSDGTMKSVTDPPNEAGQRYRLDYTYDPVVGTYVEAVTDSFGLTSRLAHEFKYGQVTTTTDVNNQVITSTYDKVGRLATVTGPYEAPEDRTTLAFEYHPEASVPWARTKHVDREGTGTVRADTIDTITFVDGLRRTVQTKKDATVSTGPDSPAADVMTVSGRVVYDFVGRAVQQFYPTTEPKGPANTAFSAAVDGVAPTRLRYDVLDRSVETVLPDGTSSSTTHGFGLDRAGRTQFEQVDTDANGKSKRTYSDVRQQTTAVKEFNPAGGQPVIWTSYGHDALGQLTSTVDDRNNVTSSAYDDFGRRTLVDSPDAGRTTTGYDLAGNVVTKVTAKLAAVSRAIEYDYDFNRATAIRYPVFPANNVSYTYGGPGAPANAAGRITEVTDGAGVVSREYGPLGEVVKESRTSAAQGSHVYSFSTEYRYDSFNRMLGLSFPDGEVLTYRYDSGGLVTAATGTKGEFSYPYLERLDYDKFGQRVLLDTGNGTRTRYTYNAQDRRLSTLESRLGQGYVFQNLQYGYDDVGNVASIRNETVAPSGPEVGMQVGGPSTQTFGYDDLYRLTHAEGTYQPRTPRTDRYRYDLSYDTVSNITAKRQTHEMVSDGNVIVQGKTSYDYAYTYASGRPHAPSVVGPYTLAYDQNGNQVSRSQQPKPRRQLIWDEENRLACSHENVQSQTLPQTPASCDNAGGTPNNARYHYDDKGNRVVKDGAQFHIYPNQNYSTRGNQQYKHVYIGSTKLITKFVEPEHRFEDRQYYSHGDHLGSTAFVTDDQGGLSEHLQYFPGGETWVSEHPSQPLPQQFTGKEQDPETGLYYFGARYYDPRTQAWQSPDPALESYLDGAPNGGVYAPSNLGLYTYAQNNPVRLVDPDGQWVNVAIGAGIGLLVGVGIEGARQAIKGEFNAGRLAGAAGAGVVSGAIAGATMGTSLIVEGAGAVAGGVAGGVVSRAIAGEKQTAEAVVVDAVISGVTFGVVKGGSAAIRSLRGSPTPTAAPPPTPATPPVRPATQQPMGGGGVVLRDAQGATAAEVAASTTGPTAGNRTGQATVRQQLIDEADAAGGPYTCWRCGQTTTNPSNVHLGHRNAPTSRGGNLERANVCIEGAACNLSANNRGGPSPGMSCAERGSCGAPYGRTD